MVIVSTSHSVHCREVWRGCGSELSLAVAADRRKMKLDHFMMGDSTLCSTKALEDYVLVAGQTVPPLYRSRETLRWRR